MTPICGQPLYRNGKLVAVCILPHGTEHDHESNMKPATS